MAAATCFTDKEDSGMEEAKSVTGCCDTWIQESGLHLTRIRQPFGILVKGQFLGCASRHVILELLDQVTPESRRREIAKHLLGMLNTNEGGSVYFGVNCRGELQGLPQTEETTLKNDVEAVVKTVNSKEDHSYHYALHFFRIYRYHVRGTPSATDSGSTGRASEPPAPDQTRPTLCDLVFPVLAVSKCRAFPTVPYTSSLLETNVTFFRRDGSTSPLSMIYFDSEEKWRRAHASLYLQQRCEEEVATFRKLTRLKEVIFALSDKLVQYEKTIS